MEARGEIRGGRFVSGPGGEQFARPEALDLLRQLRRESNKQLPVTVSTADPLNLAGIILPGPRVNRFAALNAASA
jgi:ATP-dependent Lhr-like helicase